LKHDLLSTGRDLKHDLLSTGRHLKHDLLSTGRDLNHDLLSTGRDLKHDLLSTGRDLKHDLLSTGYARTAGELDWPPSNGLISLQNGLTLKQHNKEKRISRCRRTVILGWFFFICYQLH